MSTHPEILKRQRAAILQRAAGCTHSSIADSAPRCFRGSVAETAADENRAAHGNIEVTETCRACGAIRLILINGRHTEYGRWHADTADLDQRIAAADAAERRELDLQAIERKAWRDDLLAVDGAVPVRVQIAPYRDCDQVRLTLDGTAAVYSLGRIEDTATDRRLDDAQRLAWTLIARRARRAAAGARR